MTTSAHRFRIVAALDRSEYAEIVLEHAIDQAMRHDRPDLHFVSVVDANEDAGPVKEWMATLVLQGLENIGPRSPDWRSRLHVVAGIAADEITTLSADLGADLLVVGRFGVHERSGSTADAIVAKATCPTLVVGLSSRSVDVVPQCPACVEVREESDGERLFCPAHTDHRRLHLSSMLDTTVLTRGGSVW